ncbi:LacI family DNA-binding transcriptional regulator [Phytohabitans aurantiacus]|jgi:LacI family transcriptional regulator|uniref:LacI family DNA-binding transcriptional regulator n=1 Tax=Phytohabitans aurantiacus TaxID=3016789 RepID=UPI0024904539|nr:LacI family DNA-binding transcriptional regulator [Phytohabitans aurantiacus]
MKKPKVKIRTVAEAAGVSVTTVSLVLNNVASARVGADTRQRIHEAAERLGYVPNEVARQLRAQRTNTLGLLGDEVTTTPFAGRMVLGAQEAASKHGWLLMLLNTGLDPELERKEISALLQSRVDGVLYTTMYHRVVRVPDQLRTVPTVVLDAEDDSANLPSVVPDEEGGAYLATKELLDHGHRRIGFVNSNLDIPATSGRLAGYQKALRQADVPFDPRLVVSTHPVSREGYAAASELLSRRERPSALFCFNDRVAMGAYQAASALGLRIPADLSVVGFDDQEEISEGLLPGLTTVALPHYAMGAWAVDALIARILDPNAPVERAVLPCPLVRRESVAPPVS